MASTPGGKTPRSNGLSSFNLHAFNAEDQQTVKTLDDEAAASQPFGFAAVDPASLDPETVARNYLNGALSSEATPSFTAPVADESEAKFKVIGTETVPLTGTRTVKFRQAFHDIPVYGSLVTVELDDQNALVSLTSALGEPAGVKPVAKISPADAAKAVAQSGPYKADLTGAIPRLSYYYDAPRSKWRLVFIFEDVPVTPRPGKKGPQLETDDHGHGHGQGHGALAARYIDYVIDAHTGIVVAELPRTPSMAAVQVTVPDGAAPPKSRTITVEDLGGGKRILKDSVLNVATFDFAYQDPTARDAKLPGVDIAHPWTPDSISAHANAASVAEFLRQVVRRNNIDGQGGPMNSAVNCVVARESNDGRQWLNAFWDGDQMVYGQVKRDNRLVSLGVALDIVGHEMFHGVTDNTSRLEYANQSGALNESYSDIFGILIANRGLPNPRLPPWDWRLGVGFNTGGKPFRDMANPKALGQPEHMDKFVRTTRDNGGVHTNSGIHNKAAFNIMTAADHADDVIFSPDESAAIFYLALTQYLSRTSQFSDSRRAVLTATRTLFRNEPPEKLGQRTGAVEAGFAAVGIL